MNFMHPDTFERLEYRYDKASIFLEDRSQFDPEILMAIITVNKHPELVTVNSRQGTLNAAGRGYGYITFGVLGEQGLAALFKFQSRLIELRGKAYESVLMTEYKHDITLREKGPNAASYPVWTLKWGFDFREVPQIFQHINTASLTVLE